MGDNHGASVDGQGTVIPGTEEGFITVRAAWPFQLLGPPPNNEVIDTLHVDKHIRIGPSGAGGCGSCGQGLGTATAKLRGVDFRLDLGRDTSGWTYGELRVNGPDPSTAFSAGLRYNLQTDLARSLAVSRANDGAVEQVKTPAMLVSIKRLAVAAGQYTIDFHALDVNGQSAASPFQSWIVTLYLLPGPSGPSGASLICTKMVGGQSKLEYRYYQYNGGPLELETSDTAGTARTEVEQGSPSTGTRTYQIFGADGAEAYRVVVSAERTAPGCGYRSEGNW